MNPQTPLPAGQDRQSTSSSPQVDWSCGDSESGRRAPARHVYSLSEPNKDLFSNGLNPSTLPFTPHTSYSSPRRHAQRSMPDDPQSRGSPLKPAQNQDVKSSKSSRTYSAVRRGKSRAQACPDMGSYEGHKMVNRQSSEPSQSMRARSTGSINCNDDPIPFYVPNFANRLGSDRGVFPGGFQHQPIPQQYPPMHNQTRPLYMHAPTLTHSMSFHNDNSFGQSTAYVFPSHSFSSNQPFHKAQGCFQVENNDDISQSSFFEPYAPGTPTPNHATPQPQVNPYAQDANGLGGPAYFQGSNNYAQQQVIVSIIVTLVSLLTRRRSNITSTRHWDPIESCSLIRELPKTCLYPRTYVKLFSSRQKQL